MLGSVTSEDEADPEQCRKDAIEKRVTWETHYCGQAKRNARLDFLKSQGAEIHSSNRRIQHEQTVFKYDHRLKVGGQTVASTDAAEWTDQDQEMKYALDEVRKQIEESQDEKTTVKQESKGSRLHCQES